MCDLVTALTIGSTIIGGVGAVQQAQATAASQKYNAAVQDMNATLSERQAKDALERGADEEQRKRQQVQALLGQQKASMAANGVDTSFGSPLDTLVDTSIMGELDALTIRTNAARESYDYKVQAVNQRAGATLNRMGAQAALTGGYLDAMGTVLGGASKAYSSYKTNSSTSSTVGTI